MRWPWQQAPETPAPEPAAEEPVMMVSSDSTIGEIIEYVNSSGNGWPLNFYGVGAKGSGNPITFATFFRCITLLSSVAAQVITSGVRVIGPDGRNVKGYKAGRAIELLTTSPNGSDPAYSFIEDVMTDLLIDGNALIRIENAGGRVAALRRLAAFDAQVERGKDGTESYFARLLEGNPEGDDHTWTAAANVIHARWPRVRGTTSRFAAAPVQAIRPALDIGLAGDKYIRDWFKTGGAHKAQIGISYPQRLNPDQAQQIGKNLENYKDSTAPLVIGGQGTFTNLSQRAQTADSAALRAYQVRDVARVYGVPAPVLGEDVTQWGSGIEQLAKLLWRFGAKQHTDRLLAACSFRLLDARHKFIIDDVELLRGSAVEIAQLITATVGDSQRPQIATLKEARKWLGLAAEPDGPLYDARQQMTETRPEPRQGAKDEQAE